MDEERLKAATRNSVEEKGTAKGRVKPLWARGTSELSEVASGSAMQGLWVRNGKVRYWVSGEHRSRFPGRRTVRRGGRRGRRASDRVEMRVYRFRV